MDTIFATITDHNAFDTKRIGMFQDKYDKLVLLLSGVSVKVADIQVSSAAHPLGVRFCTLLIAKKLVVCVSSCVFNRIELIIFLLSLSLC